MSREGGLGKGLSSLIPQKKKSTSPAKSISEERKTEFVSKGLTDESVVSELIDKKNSQNINNAVLEVDINRIVVNPFQPRKYFNEVKLEELATSIRKHGIIQPLIVTKKNEGNFELVAGERRFKASKKNGLSKVPVIVKKISDKEKMEWALVENIQRDDLNSIEEAEAYQGLIQKFNYTQDEVAKQVGRSRSAISNITRLLDLSSRIKQKIKTGEISEGHARALLRLDDLNQREILVNQIINEGLSVREAERKIKKNINSAFAKSDLMTDNSEVAEFEDKISQVLGTKVCIKKGRKGGKFILNYYSEEEFGNLFNKLIS